MKGIVTKKHLIFLLVSCPLLAGVVGVTEFFSEPTYTIAPQEVGADQEKTKILVVVGHDNEVWGTQFLGVKEVELNRILGLYLYDFLKSDPLFDPAITQTDGDYITELATFFKENIERIKEHREERRVAYRTERKLQEDAGEERDDVIVKHNPVTDDVANKLYGLGLWAEDNAFDVLVHIHFNDYPGRPRGEAGKYSGFSMYVPHHGLKNSEESIALGKIVYGELLKQNAPSNLPVEKDGLIESAELIVLGARNSLRVPSILVEYGYIAEPRFNNAQRDATLRDLAEQTYVALKEFYVDK